MKIVRMATLESGKEKDILRTNSLGSCVGIVLYNKTNRTGCLSHAMLPIMYNQAEYYTQKAKFVDSSIEEMIHLLSPNPHTLPPLEAMIFGGSQMFFTQSTSSLANIGKKNTDTALQILSDKQIPVLVNETGGKIIRTVELHCMSGCVMLYEQNKLKNTFSF